MFTLQVMRNGNSLGYVACQDDRDVITSVERHAQRFSNQKSLNEYVDMVKADRARVKLQATDTFRVETAVPLF